MKTILLSSKQATFCIGTTDGVFEAGGSDFDNTIRDTEGRSGGEENATFC